MSDHPPGWVPTERGRYTVYAQEDESVVIARSGPLCDRCESCGCGEKRDPVGPISGQLVRLARSAANGETTLAGALKAMIRL